MILFTLLFVTYYAFRQSRECFVCQEVVSTVTRDVTKYNSTITDLATLVDDLCRDIGGAQIGKQCDFIISNLKYIVEWISQGKASSDICTRLKMCP